MLLLLELRNLKINTRHTQPTDLPDKNDVECTLKNSELKEILRTHIGEDILNSVDGTSDLLHKYNKLKEKIRERDTAIKTLGNSLFAAEERNSDIEIKYDTLRLQLERRNRMLQEQRKRFYTEFIALKEQLFLKKEGQLLDPRTFILDLERLMDQEISFEDDKLQLASAQTKLSEYRNRYDVNLTI